MQQTESQETAPKLRLDSEFWTADEIAYCLGYSKNTVQAHIITRSDFPEPRYMIGNGRRWIRKEVIAWGMNRRTPNQASQQSPKP